MTPSASTKSPKAPQPATTALKQLPFAFPFLRRAQGESGALSQFTDEHDIYRLLAEREQGGEYLVSHQGLWHGGFHVAESGAGQSLDLDAGVRCIADGVLIAFRANKAYPVSDVPASNGKTPAQVPYSTGFALVRHEMEFPRGSKLTFYSLYMHLMANEDYDRNYPKRQKPSYWSRQWTVTDCAKDRQSHRAGQAAEASQVGLRVRKAPGGHIVGIAPQGASLSIGRTATVHGGTWGQVTDLHGTTLYAPEAGGYVAPGAALNGWIYLGKQNGGPVVKESIPDSMFDRVIVLLEPPRTNGPPQVAVGGITVKAGDAIGHLGRFDTLSGNTTGDRRVHIEVFCDDSIVQFLEQSRDWINRNCALKANWDALGLPSEPTILRIGPGTVLYQRTPENQFIPGSDSQSNTTAVVQVYSIAELARNKDSTYTEKDVDAISKCKLNWYHVDSANTMGHAIKGWVRELNHPGGGRVTREFAQDWIDFNALPADAHDPAHTIFATVHEWVDYLAGTSITELASRTKLSPLMKKIYDTLFKTGNGKQAAGELRAMATTGASGFPWLMLAASRLIAKHESEWAKPSKWQQLFAALKRLSGADSSAQHEAEQQRIDNIVWWEEVKAGISGFPGPDVYHINPIGLTGNFIRASDRSLTIEEARVRAFLRMIRVGEGTETAAGYERLFGGESFIKDYDRDFSDHPRILIARTNSRGKTLRSTAAGAYQIMGYNWDDPTFMTYRSQYRIANFSPISQDRYCVILLKYKRHALDDIKNGDVQKAVISDGCNLEWASLPGNDYGQGGVGMTTVFAKFSEYLSDELSGKSDLAVPIGGLDDLIK